MSKVEEFSSRWGLLLASLGMAIGAGNLWRFPRLAGQYGGAFLILWIVFLLTWSIPLLLAEFSIGKKYKKGVIGSYGLLAGKKFVWGGFFITLCTLGIAFYYSVVTGWALRYLGVGLENIWNELVVTSGISEQPTSDPEQLINLWNSVSNTSILTVILHIIAVIAGVLILAKGIRKGLEKANKILIPSLFILLGVIAIVALSMDNGIKGLEYMFHVDVALFSEPKIWLEALSQSAWSTGAGWGLLMTITSYSRNKEDVTLNTFIGAFGNNTASLLAGMAILPAVFALAPSEGEAISFLQSGSQALTFTVIPGLFAHIPGGSYLNVLFFTAFFMAAFSSLLPMLELFLRNLADLGFARKSASVRVALFCIVFGFPSAWSLDFFNNQDWVWGLGLIISGWLIMMAVVKHGPVTFKREFIDKDSDFKVSNLYFSVFMYLNMFVGIFLIYWWMSQGYSEYPWFDENGIWNIIDVYSNASVISQWGIVILGGMLINGFLYKKFVKS
ncbi:MAG: sodium-dependent transporter [Cyclobacteriaceae bacterium]|nr:sodium-dependent transporter [Cyclobacteriaceae bacterium]